MSESGNPPTHRYIHLANLALVMFCIALLAFVYGIDWFRALQIPYPIEYEGPIIWAGWQLLHGANIYSLSNLTTFPWIVTIYPPLFFLVSAGLVKVFGLAIWPLRALSMLSAVSVAGALYRVLRLCRVPPPVIASALIFLLCTSPVCFWSFKARTDMLAAALSFWAVERLVSWWLGSAKPESNKLGLLPVILLSVLGVFTKQESIVVVPAIFVFLLWQKSPRLATWYLAGWSAAVAGISVVLQAMTGGYFAHLTFLTESGWDPSWVVNNIESLKASAIVLAAGLGISIAGFIAGCRTKPELSTGSDESPEYPEARRENLQKTLPVLLLVTSLVIAIYHLGVPASHINALISTSFALAWCLSIALPRLPALCLTLILCSSLLSCQDLHFVLTISPKTLANTYGRLNAAHLTGKTVLSEDPYLNLLTGSQAVMVDCATFNSAWRNQPQKWQPIARSIAAREYGGVIICTSNAGEYSFWPDEIVNLTKANYDFFGNVTGNGRNLALYLPHH